MDVHGMRDIRTLERIVALLAALAGLAEMAAGRSFPVRFMVLAILRPLAAERLYERILPGGAR